ncbi:hypothetical protein [Paludibacterium yongneupense]|uniref:hypothetical protein n=1 Tax=Paludibacterium yongneupense TaxID=400061 RepID=UPI000417BBAC|nr:hypothetical protein [Paludibacterium yongneupense]
MPSVDRKVVGEIFRIMRGRFGSPFIAKFQTGEFVPKGLPFEGYDVGLLEAMDVWVETLKDLTPTDIKHGIAARYKHPPSCDEFIAACCGPDREYASQAIPGLKAIPAPILSRAEASRRLAELTDRRLCNGGSISHRERELLIAEQIAQGTYPGGLWPRQMTARYLHSIGELPKHMTKYLTVEQRGDAA